MNLANMVSHVPLWAWAILASGLWMGVSAMRKRTVKLWFAALMPLVFWGLSLSNLVTVFSEAPAVAFVWLLAVAAGAAAGWFFLAQEPLEVRRGRGELVLPGTLLSLVMFLVIFSTKFVYNYEQAADAALAASAVFQLTVFGLSGLSTGIVTARTAKLFTRYFQTAPQEA